MSVRIMKRTVDAATSDGRDAFLWDAELKGFGLKVTPAGRKVYLVQYRMGGRGTPTKRYTIGTHGSPWTPDEARNEAKRLLGLVADGIDPATQKAEQRAGEQEAARRRFEPIALDFVLRYHLGITAPAQLAKFSTLDDLRKRADEAEGLVKKPRNKAWRQPARILSKYVLPTWGARDIGTIKRQDVARLLAAVAENSGPVQANRTLAAIRKLFNWAMLQPGLIDVLEASPIVPGMAPGAEHESDRFLAAWEIPFIWRACESVGYPFGLAARAMLVLGQRREEVGGMLRSGLDLENRIWTLPRESTKAARRHEVMLSDLAVELIEAAKPAPDPETGKAPDLLFTTTGQTPVSGWSRAKERIDAKVTALLAEDAKANGSDEPRTLAPWTYHDLRRTMATHMEDELSIPKHIVSAILNHAETGATSVYTKGELRKQKRAAMDAWARYLLKLLGREGADNVVPLRA